MFNPPRFRQSREESGRDYRNNGKITGKPAVEA